MLRRLTAVIAMLVFLALLGMLVWAVQEHRRRSFMGEPTTVVNFARTPALIG
jgi:cytosine/uracil/thiamine/allantoin permease